MHLKTAIIIEDDKKFAEELQSALQEIDPQLKIEIYGDIKGLQGWVVQQLEKQKKAAESDKKTEEAAPAKPGKDKTEIENELKMIVCRKEFLGTRFLRLLERTRDFLIRKNLCTKEAPTAFVLTAFDDEHFNVKKCRGSEISAILMKPFDKPVMQQQLFLAWEGEKPFSTKYLYVQKTTAQVEMIKDVQLSSLSEVGFTTFSDRPLAPGEIAKYYHDIFKSPKKTGLLARCILSQALPLRGSNPQLYHCEFEFLGGLMDQYNSIRKYVKGRAKNEVFFPYRTVVPKGPRPLAKPVAKVAAPEIQKKFPMILIDPQSESGTALKKSVEEHFPQIQIVSYSSYLDFLVDVNPTKSQAMTVDPKAGAKAATKPRAIPQGTFLFTFQRATRAPLKVNPEPTAAQLFFGLPWAQMSQKAEFFDQKIEPADRPSYTQLFQKGQTIKKAVVKARLPDGLPRFLEFERKEDKGDDSLIYVRELDDDEARVHTEKNRPFKSPILNLCIEERFLGDNPSARLEQIYELLKTENLVDEKNPLSIFVLASDVKVSPPEKFKMPQLFDVLYAPLDRAHLALRIAKTHPQLQEQKQLESLGVCLLPMEIKTSRDVKISEVSEAGIVLKYNREIPIGEFRSFYLPIENSLELLEFTARCHFSKKSEGAVTKDTKDEGFSSWFTFFGLSDHYLKYVRRWIRQYYVEQKSDNG